MIKKVHAYVTFPVFVDMEVDTDKIFADETYHQKKQDEAADLASDILMTSTIKANVIFTWYRR